MKKLIFLLLLVAGMAAGASAQQRKFYYYPSANVYYDPGTKLYIYPAGGNWTRVKVLPAGFKVSGAPRYTVYSERPEVWVHNGDHQKKYNAPNGKAVGYKGTNPNKAKGKGKKS